MSSNRLLQPAVITSLNIKLCLFTTVTAGRILWRRWWTFGFH